MLNIDVTELVSSARYDPEVDGLYIYFKNGKPTSPLRVVANLVEHGHEIRLEEFGSGLLFGMETMGASNVFPDCLQRSRRAPRAAGDHLATERTVADEPTHIHEGHSSADS